MNQTLEVPECLSDLSEYGDEFVEFCCSMPVETESQDYKKLGRARPVQPTEDSGDLMKISLNKFKFDYRGENFIDAFNEALENKDYLGLEVLGHELAHCISAHLMGGDAREDCDEGVACFFGKYLKHYAILSNTCFKGDLKKKAIRNAQIEIFLCL